MNIAANKLMMIPDAAVASWAKVGILSLNDNNLVRLGSLEPLKALTELRIFSNNLEAMPTLCDNCPVEVRTTPPHPRIPLVAPPPRTLPPSFPPPRQSPVCLHCPALGDKWHHPLPQVFEIHKNRIETIEDDYFKKTPS